MRELSLNVMDVVQNSIAAEAGTITVCVEEDTGSQRLVISIEDDGRGMTPQQVEQVQSPFYTTRTTRPVGLGVPLFKMASEQTGGTFQIASKQGEGTVVRAQFNTAHIDMTPLGDMNETVLLLVTCNPALDFVYRRRRDGASFTLDTRELREILGGEVPLNDPAVADWIRGFLSEQEGGLAHPE